MSHGWTGEVWRFGVCGLVAAATDVGLYELLGGYGGLHPVAAHMISRPVGGLVSFTTNRLWTFRYRPMNKSVPIQFGRYWVVWLCAYALSVILLWVWLRILPGDMPFNRILAKLLAEGCVGTLSFLAQRFWTFR